MLIFFIICAVILVVVLGLNRKRRSKKESLLSHASSYGTVSEIKDWIKDWANVKLFGGKTTLQDEDSNRSIKYGNDPNGPLRNIYLRNDRTRAN